MIWPWNFCFCFMWKVSIFLYLTHTAYWLLQLLNRKNLSLMLYRVIILYDKRIWFRGEYRLNTHTTPRNLVFSTQILSPCEKERKLKWNRLEWRCASHDLYKIKPACFAKFPKVRWRKTTRNLRLVLWREQCSRTKQFRWVSDKKQKTKTKKLNCITYP